MSRERKPLVLAGAALLAIATGATAARPRPPSSCILVVEETGALAIVEPRGAIVRRLALGERPHEIEVAPGGRVAYVSLFGITDYDSRIGTPGTRIARIDLTKGSISAFYTLPKGLAAPHGLKLRPPKRRELFVNAEAGGDAMVVFDAASGRVLRRFPLPPGLHNFVFARDGESLYGFAGARGVSRIDATTGRVIAHRDLGSPVRGLFVAASGNVLAAGRGEIAVLSGTDLEVVARRKAPRAGQHVYLAELADGTVVAPSLDDGGVSVFPSQPRPVGFVPTGKTPIAARQGPDGRVYVTNADDDHVTVLDAGLTPVSVLPGLSQPNGLGFGRCPTR